MKEISLHILDIMQNSVAAKADFVTLTINEDTKNDTFDFSIEDNGCGMSEELVKRVIDPFVTGRTTRKVGLGIPLLKHAAEATGGGIEITSEEGVGTTLTARFSYSHIDRQPLGDMAQTMLGFILTNPGIDVLYRHSIDGQEFVADTRSMKEILGEVPLTEPEVAAWLAAFLKEGEEEIKIKEV